MLSFVLGMEGRTSMKKYLFVLVSENAEFSIFVRDSCKSYFFEKWVANPNILDCNSPC